MFRLYFLVLKNGDKHFLTNPDDLLYWYQPIKSAREIKLDDRTATCPRGKVLTLGDRVQTDKTALIAAMGADSFSATLLMMGK